MRRRLLPEVALTTALLASWSLIGARDAQFGKGETSAGAVALPQICVVEQNIGNMALTVTNKGLFGSGYYDNITDCFTGLPVRSCEFPIGSRQSYLWSGAIWVGGVVGPDTLVSVGADGWQLSLEFNPDVAPLGGIRYRSTLSSLPQYRDSAVSHQDFLATYWDTCLTCNNVRPDYVDHRPHRPMGLRIDQRSYAWNYSYTRDFVIFDLTLTNMQSNLITNAYFGIYVDADVTALNNMNGYIDDLTGFVPAEAIPGTACPDAARIPLAWIADNDGDLSSPFYGPVPHVTGTALLHAPVDSMAVSFNWWVNNGFPLRDFGPMRRTNFRDFGTGGTGTPEGDRNKYWVLRNGDIDYDQVFAATISPDDTVWMSPPPEMARDMADGYETRYLLSVGPFNLAPGESVPLTFAYVGGKNFHTDPNNVLDNLPFDPRRFYERLNFANLTNDAVYASWIYDNPGVDTDGDGFAGQFTICNSDTVWSTGDGVPDFRAAFPPPRPELAVTPLVEGLLIRWNGLASETTRDLFSRRPDFEGYNVYLRRIDDPNWQRIANYDLDSYFKMAWDFEISGWRPQPYGMTLSELRCLYAGGGCEDASWSPNTYSSSAPYILPGASDSIFYFVPVGCNASRFGFETAILKTYPSAPKPRWNWPDDVPADSAEFYLNADGKFMYYEYQLIINGLLPGERYQVNVTATDYGPAFSEASYPLETSPDEGFFDAVPFSTNCCAGPTGNVDCSPGDGVDISDLSELVDFLYVSFSPLCCAREANVDGDPSGGIDISDLSALVDYLYVSFTPPAACQ